MKVWIARDEQFNERSDTKLFVYSEKPEFSDISGEFANGGVYEALPSQWFPEIEPGECYEVEITLGKKV